MITICPDEAHDWGLNEYPTPMIQCRKCLAIHHFIDMEKLGKNTLNSECSN